jgi:putative two-component system response regulator
VNESPSSLKVLVVDDDPNVTRFLTRLLAAEGHDVTVAEDGPGALDAIAGKPPDVILLDIVLPGINGLDICRRLKRDVQTRLLPVILITGLTDREPKIEGLEAGADDFLTKPVDPQELLARVRSLGRMKRYTDDLDSAAAIIMMLAVMIEGRDGLTAGHCHRMANYATALGRRLGIGDDALRALHRGGFLHDVGMLTVPDSVLRKPGRLMAAEYELVKSHTLVGDSLCQTLRTLEPVRPIVRHHHERLDGSGYPDGLEGDAIPLIAQITSIADTYDAATTRRPYQDLHSAEDAVRILRQQVGLGWKRSDLVEEFVAIVQSGGLETFNADAHRIEPIPLKSADPRP